MGGFLSVQSKEKRRRSNRLSKPPPNKAALGSISSRVSHQASSSNSPTCSQAAAWQNPWTGTSIPVSAPDSDTGGRRSQSLPSVSYQPGAPWPSVSKTRKSQSMVKAPDDIGLHSYVHTAIMSDSMGGQASRRSSRQRSFQTATTNPNGLEPSIARQPSRSYSMHSPPQRTQSTMHHSTIEEATSSNTLFMVDSQGFSLIRRRSLLTRPGVATRRSTRDTARRLSSPVDQETHASINYRNGTYIPSRLLLSDCEDAACGPSGPLPQLRPPTPNDFEYTHLGALKLGSLRVVNGSASPCPSDRTRLNRPNSPIIEANDLGTHGLEPKQPIKDWHHTHQAPIHPDCESQLAHGSVPGSSRDAGLTRSGGHDEPKNSDGGLLMKKEYSLGLHKNRAYASMLKIPATSDTGKHEDYPASPFSFEKSPTIPTAGRLHGNETEDEGICVHDEEKMSVPQLDCTFRDCEHRELQHPHRKVDSGYSSAASVRSIRRSTDSHTSAYQSGGPRRFTFGGSPRDLETWDAKASPDVEDQPPVHRRLSLHDPTTGPKIEICGWSTHGTSMCHDSQRIPTKGRLRSSSFSASHEPSHAMSFSQYCHQLRSLENASPGISVVTADSVPHPFPQIYTMKQPIATAKDYDAQTSSSSTGTVQLPRSNPNALGMSDTESAEGVGSGRLAFSPPRGRTRSRSIECQQKRLAKHAKRPNLYMAASPFIFH